MSVEISYRVIHLARIGPSVKMVLEEVRTVPPEEIERAHAEAEKPELDAVDAGDQLAKIESAPPEPKDPIRHMFWAMKQEFPEMAEAFKSRPSGLGAPRGGRVMRVVPISQMIEGYFTPEQYAELGSPPLLSTIRVVLTLQ